MTAATTASSRPSSGAPRTAVAWELTDTIALGWCREGCPWAEQLTAGPGGVMFNFVHTLNSERAGVYWSSDGRDFRKVDKSMFGLDPEEHFSTSAATVAQERFVLVAGRGAWSSADGREWSLDMAFPGTSAQVDIASDGSRAVVADWHCAQDCPTEIWTSTDGRTDWIRTSQTFPVIFPRVAYAGGSFLLAGMGSSGTLLYTSPDGVGWVERPRRDLPLQYCTIESLAGYGDRILIVGGGETCFPGVWVTRAPAS